MELRQAAEYCADLAARSAAEDFDLLALTHQDQELSVYQSKINKSSMSDSQGIGIRVLHDQRPGYAWSARLSEAALKQMVADANQNALLTDPVAIELPAELVLPEIELEQWNADLIDFDGAQMLDLILEIESTAHKSDERIDNVPVAACGKSHKKSIFINSKGVLYERRANSISAVCGVSAKQNSVTKSGYYSQSGRDAKLIDTRFIAEHASQRATELLDLQKPARTDLPVVLSNRITPSLFGLYQSMFFAEQVQKGQSRLQDKLGQQIAFAGLQLRNNPHGPWPGSALVDGEGIVCQEFPVIEDGRLQSYLYHLESAQKDQRNSNGCASRSLGGKVSTGFSNLIVETGPNSLTELLNAYLECLYILKLEGAAACSAISGDISIGAQGFYMRDGHKLHAFDGLTISMNFLDLLQNIEMISDQWSESWSSIKVPDLLVRGFGVSV